MEKEASSGQSFGDIPSFIFRSTLSMQISEKIPSKTKMANEPDTG